MKVAVIVFNLGGPDRPEAVEPFLRNLFSDSAIIALPGFFRVPLAWFIARRRAPLARAIYAKIGGRSPIVDETKAQAHALESVLAARGLEARAFLAMRYSEPSSAAAAAALRAFAPDRVVLLPLYPQFSTTTTASSLKDWGKAAPEFAGKTARVCCFPWEKGFVAAQVKLIRKAFSAGSASVDYRLLLSAHGLPKRTVLKGDPYQWQVEKTAHAIVDRLGIEEPKLKGLDFSICYQSRVGPLEWIGPATDAEIRRAGQEGKGVIVAPIAFVSEHSETLVELDIEYRHLAKAAGVPDYLRVPAVNVEAEFIEGLADMVEKALVSPMAVTCAETGARLCPAAMTGCGWGGADAC